MNSYIHIKSKEKKSIIKINSLILYRFFDITFGIFAIILFMPIMIIITILIKINSPKDSIIFKQKRLGLHGKVFNIYKFRTMIPDAEEKLKKILDENSNLNNEYIKFRKLKNDPRIIPNVGIFLRKSSLDELPQFFNVLLGQMSIVGPRPYIENEFDIYPTKSHLKIVTSIKPGITGYWQIISERHDTTFDSRVKTDIKYIQNKNFILDLKIIAQTVKVMILRKGK